MAFTNTVETVGDAALTRSIIDKSITELNCNITTSIRVWAFRACTKLASVNFPNCTTVSDGAFYGCSALAKADFASSVIFKDNAFYGCSNLTALILRSTTLCTFSGTPFASSAIEAGTGYIYVLAALVDQYKASLTAYAAQIRAIEDYPEIVDPYSWAAVFKAIDNGTYATVYKVGDLIPLDMGTEGQINMQIARFNADDLADGTGKAHISFISQELLKTSKSWNPALVTNDDGTYQEGTGTIGGWEKSELRAYYNDTLLPLIPSEVAARIKPVTKTQDAFDTAGAKVSQTTTDIVWAPSKPDVSGTPSNYYALFKDTKAKRIKTKVGASSATIWWLRSAQTTYKADQINASGTATYNDVNHVYALVLGFCI